jgi:hypothetical protein
MGLVPRTLHLPHASPLKIPVVAVAQTAPVAHDVQHPTPAHAVVVPAPAEVTPPYRNPLLIAARTDH